MYDQQVRSYQPYSLDLPIPVTAVCLFCLCGLLASAMILPMFTPDDVNWALFHIE